MRDDDFILGFLIGAITATALGYLFIVHLPNESCAKKYNVYACELTPVKGK